MSPKSFPPQHTTAYGRWADLVPGWVPALPRTFRRRCGHRVASGTVLVLWLPAIYALLASSALQPSGSPCPAGPFLPPVPDPIAIGFDLPLGHYGPGNRGLEYETPPDRPVRAIGAGEVVFAGAVAGALAVSVRHPDGLTSSYSELASVTARRGQLVSGGDEIGRSGGRFQLGVRLAGRYLDPAPLLANRLRPRLVPKSFRRTCERLSAHPVAPG